MCKGGNNCGQGWEGNCTRTSKESVTSQEALGLRAKAPGYRTHSWGTRSMSGKVKICSNSSSQLHYPWGQVSPAAARCLKFVPGDHCWLLLKSSLWRTASSHYSFWPSSIASTTQGSCCAVHQSLSNRKRCCFWIPWGTVEGGAEVCVGLPGKANRNWKMAPARCSMWLPCVGQVSAGLNGAAGKRWAGMRLAAGYVQRTAEPRLRCWARKPLFPEKAGSRDLGRSTGAAGPGRANTLSSQCQKRLLPDSSFRRLALHLWSKSQFLEALYHPDSLSHITAGCFAAGVRPGAGMGSGPKAERKEPPQPDRGHELRTHVLQSHSLQVPEDLGPRLRIPVLNPGALLTRLPRSRASAALTLCSVIFSTLVARAARYLEFVPGDHRQVT